MCDRHLFKSRHISFVSCLLVGILTVSLCLAAGACAPQTAPPNGDSPGNTAPSDALRRQGYFQDTLFTFATQSSNQELVGLMTADNTVVLPAEYEEINPLTTERYIVKKAGAYGLLGKQGQVLYPLEAAYLHEFNALRSAEGVYEEGVLLTAAERAGEELKNWTLIDLDGNTIGSETWDHLCFHSKGYIHAHKQQDGKECLLNYRGEIALNFSEQVFVYPAEGETALRKTERIVSNPSPTVYENSYYGIQDSTGNEILPAEYDSLIILSSTRILAKKGSVNADLAKVWIVDNAGRVLSDGQYNDIEFCPLTASEYSEAGIGSVMDADSGVYRYYLVDQDGSRVTEQAFDHLSFVSADALTAKLGNETYSVDLQGNLIL